MPKQKTWTKREREWESSDKHDEDEDGEKKTIKFTFLFENVSWLAQRWHFIESGFPLLLSSLSQHSSEIESRSPISLSLFVSHTSQSFMSIHSFASQFPKKKRTNALYSTNTLCASHSKPSKQRKMKSSSMVWGIRNQQLVSLQKVVRAGAGAGWRIYFIEFRNRIRIRS